MRVLRQQGIKGEPMTGNIADVRVVTCKAYLRWVATKRSGAMDLELLRAAINHAVREKRLDRPVAVWLPEKGESRERWLTRGEAAQILHAAWRQRRETPALSLDAWPDLHRAIQLRTAGHSAGQIATALGCTRNKVAGQLWRHDQRTSSDPSQQQTTRHVARFIVTTLYTGKRKTAALLGAFERLPGFGYIDLDQGVWHAPQGKRRTKKRQPAQPIPTPLLGHMRRWQRAGQRFPVEFAGEPVERLDKAFRKIVRDLGFTDVVIHTLRHTAVTWGLQRGMNLWDAAGYFGISVEVLERVYGHHSTSHLRDAAEKMARPAKRA